MVGTSGFWTRRGIGVDVRPPVVAVSASAARRALGDDVPRDPFSAACSMVGGLMVEGSGGTLTLDRAVAIAAVEAGPAPGVRFVWVP